MRRIDKVAEMMADDVPVEEIARQTNMTVASVYRWFGRIRKALNVPAQD